MRRFFTLCSVVFAVSVTSPAFAVGTIAGTDIDNTATVTYDVAGTTVTTNSNTLTITVAEILDLDVTLQSPQIPVAPGDANRSLLFTLTNTGNGDEAFTLLIDSVIAGDDFNPVPAVPAIYFDTDSSGDLSAGDTPYNPGVNDPLLVPDASVDVLLANDIPLGLVDGNIGQSELSADANTGTGAPGVVFAGQGTGGVDAVVGASGASDADTGEYIVSNVSLTSVKSATVLDPFGGTQPVPGAQVTYQIVVTVTGTGTAVSATFSDAIPVNMTYLPGSITLSGAGLTDAPDADAGAFIAAGTPTVTVTLGDLTQISGPQTITFTAVID